MGDHVAQCLLTCLVKTDICCVKMFCLENICLLQVKTVIKLKWWKQFCLLNMLI